MPRLSRAAKAAQDTTDIDRLFPLPRSNNNQPELEPVDLADDDVSDLADSVTVVEPHDIIQELLRTAASIPQVKVDVQTSGKLQIEVDFSAMAKQNEDKVQDGQLGEHGEKGYIAEQGFLMLPCEIRHRICRLAFCTDEPISFSERKGFARSSALLGTCKTVYNEGLDVLYGQNSFHFRRSYGARGPFWQEHWNDIGYKDVLRFLQMIGPKGLSALRFASFIFEDATSSQRPNVSTEQRRYVNDPVLLRIFELFHEHTVFNKFAVTFYGRAIVTYTDVHFLRAFASIRCRDLIHVKTMGHHVSKIRADLLNTLRRVTEVETPDDGKPNDKIHGRKVYMMYEWPVDRPAGHL